MIEVVHVQILYRLITSASEIALPYILMEESFPFNLYAPHHPYAHIHCQPEFEEIANAHDSSATLTQFTYILLNAPSYVATIWYHVSTAVIPAADFAMIVEW